jgi:hypothetical protein
VKRRALKALIVNDTPAVLPADKRNVTVVLDAAGYCWKIAVLLEEQAPQKTEEGPPLSVCGVKTVLLKKKFLFCEEVCQ